MVFNGKLIPWNWSKKNLPVRKENGSHSEHALENFFRTFEMGLVTPFSDLSEGMFQPRVEVKERSNDVHVSVELPGIDEKELDVSINDNYLIIQGEKRQEKEENTSGYYRMERTYGSFRRSIPFPCEVDKDKSEATFKRGVLTVILQKKANSQQHIKKITVKKE